LRLDRIYVTAHGEILKAWTDKDARRYSDHLPVIAEVAFSPVADRATSFSLAIRSGP
jgi:endonuclease/exonuclease/phosphatase family metal-dependent hydrolase